MNSDEAAWRIVATGLLAEDRPDTNGALACQLENAEQLWPQIIQFADMNFVSPGLWMALADKGLDRCVPADPAQYLGAMRDMNHTRNSALDGQLDELIGACNAAGITPGLLKGAAHLKTNLHGDKGVRLMTDLDLIVETGQLNATVKVLEKLGYATLPDNDIDRSDHHHLTAYVRAGDFGSVEIHKEPMNLEARECLSARELWLGAREVRAGELLYRVPSPTHSVLLDIVHSEVTDKNLKKLFVSLRSLQDVKAMILAYGDDIDWTEIHQRMRREGHAGIFRCYLYGLDTLTGFRPLPDLAFGLRSRVRYRACRLALRYRFLRRWLVRIYDLSAYRIGQRFSGKQTFLSRNWNRLRVMAAFVARQFGFARNSR